MRPFSPRRRRILTLLAAAPACIGVLHAAGPTALRIGLTPVFLDDQIGFLNLWRDYLQARLSRPVSFVKRASYREIVELLQEGKIEFAWLCGYPYVTHGETLRLLSVPVYQGRPLYRSYLIVPARDTVSRSIDDLRSRVFAYSDPNSNSGFLVVQEQLAKMREDPGLYFRKSFFTWSHRKVVEAVAAGLADGGAVDGYVFDALESLDPDLTSRTRVIAKSRPFGFPPVVAHRRVPREDFDQFQRVLMEMRTDEGGRGLLARLHLDAFGPPDPGLFDDIARMAQLVRRNGRVP